MWVARRFIVSPGRVLLCVAGVVGTWAASWAFPVGRGGQEAAPPPAPQKVAQARPERASSPFAAQLDKVWETVRDRFYDKNLNGVDWQRVGEEYRRRLPDVKTKHEFADLVNAMLAELRASHIFYATDEDIEFYMLPAVMRQDLRGYRVEHIGVMGQRIRGEYVVSAVLEDSPATKAGIQSGDHLLAADGKPFTSAGSFWGKEDRLVRVELRRAGETELRTVTVTPVRQNMLRAFLDATNRSVRIFEVDGKRLGYVHLWTMANEAFRSALERIVLRTLHDTDGLILDLRDGYGGSPWGYSDAFLRPDVLWAQQERGEKATSRHSGYAQPLVVLINGGTRSAKEFLTYQLRAAHRAIVVGSRTAGAFLGAGTFPVGRDGLLELAVVGLELDGKRLEGAGVLPDIAVAPEFTNKERDRQLARAKQVLVETIKRRTAEEREPPAAVAH